MTYFIGLVGVVFLLVGVFIAGILVGRKNQKKVEMAVAAAKDPKSMVKLG